METRLFCIGLGMLAYALATKQLKKNNYFASRRTFAALWHALFTAGSAFVLLLVVSVSMDTGNIAPGAERMTPGQKTTWIVILAAAALWGFFRARRNPSAAWEQTVKEDLEWAETTYSAVFLAAVVMYLFIQAFKIPSGSMRMTFVEGDHLFVNKFVYGVRIPFTSTRVLPLKQIHRGDVIVFRFPSDNPSELQCGGVQYGKDFIKRVVGIPGDTVEMKEGTLFVNGKSGEETYAQYTAPGRIPPAPLGDKATFQKTWEERNSGRTFGESLRDNFGPVTVPAGSYFAMGDNRDHSCDSRFWGPVPMTNIKGRAWFTYWPPSHMKATY